MERSALLLERFCPVYDAWLTKNPPWDGILEYEEAKMAIRAIVPVNDLRERLYTVAKRLKYVLIFLPSMIYLTKLPRLNSSRSAEDRESYLASILAAQMRKNKSSKDCTWSAVPDALLGVIQ